ncbi:hypothetical protein CLV51_10597 [Chitinophaga niastensis]|uniref:Gliding motility-associated protein GldM N-terminal domain-containing protein n=1 Tax=Chitinophaga niastensis TaxID=536980 RepID=A0A2P8HEV1_CHINA|nr:hypothetical protein [Chitinophaga niastensis]PSL44725.1 hypothetical protein CLV51_10597 [Chitinophaga niastensis]
MVLNKVLSKLALFFLLILSANVFGQSEKATVTDVTVDMLAWVKHLNNDVDKYYSREKGEALNQHFEWLKQDLNNYMKTRKVLSDSLFRNNITPGKKDMNDLEILKVKMGSIMERMRGVTDLVSPDLRAEGDHLNDEIYDILYGQKIRFLSNLEAFLGGMDISKRDLAVDGSQSYLRLEECINLIAVLQGKIDKKMKK